MVAGLETFKNLKMFLKKTSAFRYKLTFDIYALTYKLKKYSKSKFCAKFVATITDFGEEARQKSFLKKPPHE